LKQSGLLHSHSLAPDNSWIANDVSSILNNAEVRSPLITLIPGCSARHLQKRWPYYGELAEALLGDGFEVVTVPGPDEMDLCATIPGKMLTGSKFLDWFDLAGVLAASVFVVGNDTSPTHIASHLEVPGLALFGPHTSAASTSITARKLEAIEVADLAELRVETVLEAVRQLNSV
jgi:ADP-heptose:LPS heptosyltransferase